MIDQKTDKTTIATWFQQLQDDICSQLEAADGTGRFQEDPWQRPGGGGGRTRVIHGRHIEKGGVNFSAVHGILPKKIAKALDLQASSFFASGVSIVLHPRNPLVPIVHMNVRYFELDGGIWWFGGGIDLTPHYIVPADAKAFHQQLKSLCDTFDPHYYARFSQWADEYFYLLHRKERRGVGGLFFDRLDGREALDKAGLFAFVQEVGNSFCPAWLPLLERYKDEGYGERELAWQRSRRGRYVEFNLIWDKGTKFGLDTDGRTESILMSLPPLASWAYQQEVEPGSREAFTLELLRKKIEWISY